MGWWLKYGKNIKQLQVHADRGSAGPLRVIESRPELFTHLIDYWEAYQRLTSARYLGPAGPGEIPWTAINEYGYRYDFYGDDFERLSYFVTLLDGVYLSWTAEKAKPDKSSGGRRGSWQGTTPP